MTELIIASAFAILCAIVLTRERSLELQVWGMAGAVMVICGMAALWSNRARASSMRAQLDAHTPADRTVESGSEWAGSRQCRACHAKEYDSWFKSFHRTMTQRASDEAVVGDWDQVTLKHQGRQYYLYRDGERFLVDMPAFGTNGKKAGERMVRPIVMTTGSHHQQLYWMPLPWADMPVDSHGSMLFGELCAECHGEFGVGGKATPLRSGELYPMELETSLQRHIDESLLARSISDDERSAVVQQTLRMQHTDRLIQFPFAWLIKDQRWVHEDATFIHPEPAPDDAEPYDEGWSHGCDQCHAVAARFRWPGGDDYGNAAVAELGISCESCHGAAAAHVQHYRNPLTRYASHMGRDVDDIILPTKLDKVRNASVCGQCHADTWDYEDDRPKYRPGDVLQDHVRVVQYAEPPYPKWLEQAVAQDDELMSSGFWRDGTMRIAGRDYNALRKTACHLEGELTCTSCHAMHSSDPNDQLKSIAKTDAVCTSCHSDIGANVSAHTHHAEDSVGSNCYDCHMPKTTLGLLTVMRSHRIDIPTAAMSHEHGRPNACNLCHLDRTLAEVADDLERWYGQKRPEGIDDDAAAAAVEWMIAGNAVQRAVAVAHVAYPYVQKTSGTDWLAPLVAHCLTDPYPAVRYIAGHALETLPGYADFGSDYIADVVAREVQRQRATDMWTPVKAPRATLVSAAGVDTARFEALLSRRDDSPVTVNE